MGYEATDLLRLDPRLGDSGESGVEILACRLTMDDPDSDGDYKWHFAARVRFSAETPPFGLTLLLLDGVGLPLSNTGLGFTPTIDATVNIVEGYNWAKQQPVEAQLVLVLNP